MSYTVEPIDVTKTPKERIVDPRSKKTGPNPTAYSWWLAQNDKDLCSQLLSTTEYLKRTNAQRIKQASIFTRLYCGKPLYNFLAASSTLDSSAQLPIGRPTANVSYSCTDTLVSRLSQDRPEPTFLTDAGHYKERRLAKEANQFIWGELYRTRAYDLAPLALRDGCVLGDGFLKVFERDDKVAVERTLSTELLCDFNDAYYGKPRQLIQMKLVDRSVLMGLFPKAANMIAAATSGHVDNSPKSQQTVSDQLIVAEGWHLRSSEDSSDGRHSLVCSLGVIDDEVYEKDGFPFAQMGYNPNVVGLFSQGLLEILMPTQMEIYRTLIVASQSIELMGVPRVLVEEMSKILETSFNNRIGSITKYRNTPPTFVDGMYSYPKDYIEFLIANSYQMSGISTLAASGKKPAGLNSGEAQREYNDIQDQRFAALERRYQNFFPDISYLMLDKAKDIVSRGVKYKTVFPGKDGTREIDFKSIGMLKDTYVIQCYQQSSLPKDPAGRQAKLSEMRADGEISPQEFRRLSAFPDLAQSDQLAAALEERILSNLDAIVDDGAKGYQAPDAFLLDPTDLATTLTVNYINKYSVTDIEEAKLDLMRDYFLQVQDLKQAALPPPPPQMPLEGQGAAPNQLPVVPPSPSISPTSNVSV